MCNLNVSTFIFLLFAMIGVNQLSAKAETTNDEPRDSKIHPNNNFKLKINEAEQHLSYGDLNAVEIRPLKQSDPGIEKNMGELVHHPRSRRQILIGLMPGRLCGCNLKCCPDPSYDGYYYCCGSLDSAQNLITNFAMLSAAAAIKAYLM